MTERRVRVHQALGLPRQVRVLWPLCRRLLASGSRRNALIIVLVALSLVFYSLYASFLDVTYRESAKILRPADLPADIVLYVPRGVKAADQDAVRVLHYLSRREWGVLGQVATDFGAVQALFSPADAPLALPGTLVSGDHPLSGECLLPLSLQGVPGAEIGAQMRLIRLAGPGAQGPGVEAAGAGGFPAAVTVAGFYQPRDPWFDMPYVVLDASGYAAAGDPSIAFLWLHPTGDYLARTVNWLRSRFVPLDLRVPYVAQRAELPLIMTAGLAFDWARGLERAIYFPGGEAMFLLYVFFGVGVFTLMLLAFLDRRRELAVMKTLGLTSGQVATLLYMEVLAVAAVGLLVGGGLLAAGIGPLRTLTGQDYRVPAWILGSGALFSLLALLLSVWLPIGMARLATVANLLGGQPFHLAGYERRWSDGAKENSAMSPKQGHGPPPAQGRPA